MSKPRRLKWDERASAADNARRELPALVTEYFVHVRELLARKPSRARLNRIDLLCQRLRYTLELFRPCYGPGFDARMTALRKLQQLLGEANDSAAALRMLSEVMPQSAQMQGLKTLASGKAEEALNYCRDVFGSTGQERWWTTYLLRNVR